jgi:phosphoribosylanthranilate isomerase
MRVKVCGLTNVQDYLDALSLGADYTGFIFYEKSPRFIDQYTAVKITTHSPTKKHQNVGVFVNEKIEKIRDIFYSVPLDIIQLHGDEPPEYITQLNLPCWKVIRVKNTQSLHHLHKYHCNAFLLDTYKKDKYGGTGIPFNPEIALTAAQTGKQIIVSGGISTDNVENLFKLQCPFHAVDINSSIEEKPGKKSPTKMNAFFNKINQLKGKIS